MLMKMTFKDNEDGLTLNGSWYLAVSIVFFRPLLFQKSHFSEPSLITSQFSNLRYQPPPKKYQLSLWPNDPPLLHFHFSRGCLFHSHTERDVEVQNKAAPLKFQPRPGFRFRHGTITRIILRHSHTSPPLVTLWNKGQSGQVISKVLSLGMKLLV